MQDIKNSKGGDRVNLLFTICGRAGSEGFKNKNLKRLNEIPLVYYTLSVIDLYQQAHPENHILVAVNTDSKELIKLVKKQKAVCDIHEVERKEELGGDRVAKVDVIKDTYLNCKRYSNFDAVIDLDITSPMRSLKDLETAIRIFLEDKECTLVFSVVPARRSPYFNMVEKRQGYYRKICLSSYTARQQAPESFELNASIYVYRPSFLDSVIEKSILDYNCGIVIMKDYLVLDIDSEEDFMKMSMLIEYFIKSDEGLREVVANAKRLMQNGM